jgi:hypothetical protein
MEPYDLPPPEDLTNAIPTMLDALEQHLEQATGMSQAVVLCRTLLLTLDPTTPVTSWDERLLLQRTITMLTRRLQTLEMFDTLTQE